MFKKLLGVFRKDQPMLNPPQYIKIAADIMEKRGKSGNSTCDAEGRVDVVGALRLAVLGHPDSPSLGHIVMLRNAHWDAYTVTRKYLLIYLIQHHPYFSFLRVLDYDIAEDSLQSMSGHLSAWSDRSSQEEVIEWMRKAAEQ